MFITTLRVAAPVCTLCALFVTSLESQAQESLCPIRDSERIDSAPGQARFGAAVAALEDLDLDGVSDFAVGTRGIAGGGVKILFPDAAGAIVAEQIINEHHGGFFGDIDFADVFGWSVAFLGDLNGDGVGDIAVGAPGDDDEGRDRGAVWIVFLYGDGTVKGYQKISASTGEFTGALTNGDSFGYALAAVGDLDGDGTVELAVGAPGDDDGGNEAGAVWILSLSGPGSSPGTVVRSEKISMLLGGLSGCLAPGDAFGSALCSIASVPGDGLYDLAVGAPGDDGDGVDQGSVWLLSLTAVGWVQTETRIGNPESSALVALEDGDAFGRSLAAPGDISGDGLPDLAVGAPGHRDWGSSRGAVWVLALDSAGAVLGSRLNCSAEGGFLGAVGPNDRFGQALASLGDLDGDGLVDLLVGAPGSAGPPSNYEGAVWILFTGEFEPGWVRYGSGVNPVGSLTVLSGEIRIGGTVILGISNPLGTQPEGALPHLLSSIAPAYSFPLGTTASDQGMSAPGADGEFLLSLDPADLAFPTIYGNPWAGPGGPPAPIQLVIPNDPNLVGLSIFVQGVLETPSPGPGEVATGLTDALRLRIGPAETPEP